ncbi:MAG: NAD(P)-dependent oxidoreductase [Gemmatimonadetes bacterium]|jgi:nucleoside-diphosphate-sugar epimerase|nr:NAD(P)-dependent oxidoreductase [Gemmatimonadota bacterium]MBT6148902.1 NAD(P)-dependent oxidoreductase [Gemmatimonadota bacterium]MBT7863568.1 NAD(P)-dependent oxidoreductase [Gemmatimonadota bacterium]
MHNVLIIGGRGNIGAGLRTFLPRLDPDYHITSVDLPGALDKATESDAQCNFVDLDISTDPEGLAAQIADRDLVIYLARHGNLETMNALTDSVFKGALCQPKVPMVVAASSVHACDGAYSVHGGIWATWAERRFDEFDPPPERISSSITACPLDDYGREKQHVEQWCERLAADGHGAIAARWGGINAANDVNLTEKGYFSLWCHQEDAARFVHACYTTWCDGRLRSGAHYFVTSNNTYNIFDLELPRREIGYEPLHDAEETYSG